MHLLRCTSKQIVSFVCYLNTSGIALRSNGYFCAKIFVACSRSIQIKNHLHNIVRALGSARCGAINEQYWLSQAELSEATESTKNNNRNYASDSIKAEMIEIRWLAQEEHTQLQPFRLTELSARASVYPSKFSQPQFTALVFLQSIGNVSNFSQWLSCVSSCIRCVTQHTHMPYNPQLAVHDVLIVWCISQYRQNYTKVLIASKNAF